MTTIRKLGKKFLCRILERQVQDLRARHGFKVIAVVGSIGKTSTKLAIADLLGVSHRVRYQEGNYNDRLTVPLVFFDQKLPSLTDLKAWRQIIRQNRAQIEQDYPYDFVVVELGTDAPGQIAEFAYLKPDLTVITGVAEEHMEFFGTLEGVAKEELTALDFSKKVLLNVDDTDPRFLTGKMFVGYGLNPKADYRLNDLRQRGAQGATAKLHTPNHKPLEVTLHMLGQQGAKISLAAVAVGDLLGLDQHDLLKGLGAVTPFAGRLQVLPGIKGSTILDDTYNASPIAVKAGLDVLYGIEAKQRIAILGNMNELGTYSEAAHQEIGEYCDPQKLDLVVALGYDAERYLAPIAKDRGCNVAIAKSPGEAAAIVEKALKSGAVILAKGSQNGVFAEEAVKRLLANKQDAAKLVRQSPSWLATKAKQFPND